MTKENAIQNYKNACYLIENPKGDDEKERQLCRETQIKRKENYEERFRTARKYKDDPDIKELLGIKQEKEDGKQQGRNKST